MSTPSPTPTPPIRLSIWRRIFEKISGDPPNQTKLEELKKKPWYMQYNGTLFLIVVTIAFIIEPKIVTRLNSHPDLNALQTFQVNVLRTFEKNPHLLVELADGTRLTMEWPVPINFTGKFRSYLLTEDERERLPGCQATVRGALLRWTISDRFRIWELDCPEEGIHIGMDKTIPDSLEWIEIGMNSLRDIFLFWVTFILIVYLRERRGNL